MHPDISSLPSPSSFFPEVKDIASFLKPPTYEVFEDSSLSEIISEPPIDPRRLDPDTLPKMPQGAFANKWERPEKWKPESGEMRKVQWEGFSSGRSDTWEAKEQAAVRKERRDAVKRGFVYAWQRYKDYAWGN
jgi:mannosyl-oligosaccharide alpha-1,2-mannosidase